LLFNSSKKRRELGFKFVEEEGVRQQTAVLSYNI